GRRALASDFLACASGWCGFLALSNYKVSCLPPSHKEGQTALAGACPFRYKPRCLAAGRMRAPPNLVSLPSQKLGGCLMWLARLAFRSAILAGLILSTPVVADDLNGQSGPFVAEDIADLKTQLKSGLRCRRPLEFEFV